MGVGDILFDSVLGLNGITGSALLGPVTFSSLLSTLELGLTGDAKLAGILSTLELSTAGAAQLSGVLATLKLESSGAALMQGLLGEVSVSASGKVKVKGIANSLKEILDEFVDIFLSHTHPTGTGPSGPPMPPASVKANLLKSIKIGLNLE